MKRLILISLLLINCKTMTEPTSIPTYPEGKFNDPKVTINKDNITIGFASISLPPDQIIEGIFRVDFGESKHITRIWSFIGVDAGNIGEFAVDLAAPNRIYQRSLHKEANGIYDAWDHTDVDIDISAVQVHTLGHMVGGPGHLEIELILETK